jgi:hypothetical protein
MVKEGDVIYLRFYHGMTVSSFYVEKVVETFFVRN